MQTTAIKNLVATYYGTQALYGALTTTAPGSSTGTEVSGGSYVRISVPWGAASAGAITSTGLAFAVPAATTVVGFETFSAITAGTYYDGVGITSQLFSSAGTYTVTPTMTFT